VTVADPAKPKTGLRERKKQKTREAIQRAAMRLFAKHGYEETTIEEIAAAVEVSPSTFFNYFPTKEDVVLYDMYDPMAIDLVVREPKDEPLSRLARRVLAALGDVLESDKEMILARARLIMRVPELRARMFDELERTHALFSRALAERTGRKVDDFELRVTTRLLVAAIYEATMEWMRTGGRQKLTAVADHAIEVMESGAQLSRASKSSRKQRLR
jgi:AcrR family transcriptional regulator